MHNAERSNKFESSVYFFVLHSAFIILHFLSPLVSNPFIGYNAAADVNADRRHSSKLLFPLGFVPLF